MVKIVLNTVQYLRGVVVEILWLFKINVVDKNVDKKCQSRYPERWAGLQDVMRQLVGPSEDVGELSHRLQGSFVPFLLTVKHRKWFLAPSSSHNIMNDT